MGSRMSFIFKLVCECWQIVITGGICRAKVYKNHCHLLYYASTLCNERTIWVAQFQDAEARLVHAMYLAQHLAVTRRWFYARDTQANAMGSRNFSKSQRQTLRS